MGKRKHKDKDVTSELWKKIRRLERRLESRSEDRDAYYSDTRHDSESSLSPSRSEADIYTGLESDEDLDSNNVRSIVSVPEPAALETSVTNSQQNNTPTPVNSVNVGASTSTNIPELPPEILEALGESKEKEEVFGPKIREEISKRWGKIIMEGLNKEQRQKVMENIHIPENFQLLKAPKLNPEIAAVITESTKNRDKRLEKAQNHLGTGIAAVTNLMSKLIEGEMQKPDIIKKLSEIGQILLDLHNQDTVSRRKLITFSLDKKFLNIVQGVKRDSFLFGENLGDKIKATKTAEKSGLQIKRTFEPQPSTSYRSSRPARQLNSRGPPRQQNLRNRPAGGPRTQAPVQASARPPRTTDRYTSSKTTNHKSTRKTR